MYELAVRHSFGKPVVCIADNNTSLPFDIHSQRVLFYTNDMYGAAELMKSLPKYIDAAMANDSFNPIINAKSDLQISNKASDPQKSILNKLDSILERMHPLKSEPKNTYRKQRSDGTTTFYICTSSEAQQYRLIERGYKLVVQDNQFLAGF